MTKYQGYIDRIKALEAEFEQMRKKYNEVNSDYKEPIKYASTLTRFADQLNVPLWKAIEFKKYYQFQFAAKPKVGRKEIVKFIRERLPVVLIMPTKESITFKGYERPIITQNRIENIADAILSAGREGEEK